MSYSREQRIALFQALKRHALNVVSCRNKLYEYLNDLGIEDIASNDTLNYSIEKVATIEVGVTPTKTGTFDSNGTYDVSEYGSITIAVETQSSAALPTLNAPSISRSGDTLTITNPSTNGNFNRNVKLYDVDSLLRTIALSSQGGSTTVSIKSLSPMHNYNARVKCSNSANFNDSAYSNSVTFSCFSITRNVTHGTINNQENTIADGVSYAATITKEGGWWLPEHINITSDNVALEEGTDYTWDMYAGVIGLIAEGDLVITVTCEATPQLKSPDIIEFDEETKVIEVDFVKYAQRYSVLIDGVVVETYVVDTTIDTGVILADKLALVDLSMTEYNLTISESTSCYGLTYEIYVENSFIENIEIGDNV